MQQFFEYSTEVELAIKHKKPVLALESTLLTHGLAWPKNLEMMKAIEEITKAYQVVPATIAILNGKIKIGLSYEELELLVQDEKVQKASRRDIPFLLSTGLNAGTTVAASIFCAHLAGIKVFATGGIGGVHRGTDLDISADLIELTRIPIAVVCSGAKAILDLPRTLEFMETFSIPIVGFGTDTLPAFYTATTPYRLPARVDDMRTLVKLLNMHWQLKMSTAMLIANPIPVQDEIPNAIIEPAIIQALRLAEEKQIIGKEMTPFLLSEVAHATQGESLKANESLIKNNVKLGSMLAAALINIEADRASRRVSHATSTENY